LRLYAIIMLHNTKGIILRTVKYGETSIIVTIFTELFGLQSYLVNGVRTTNKKGGSKAAMFQPAAILDLVAYHNEFRNLQRLKEFKWEYLYQHIFADVVKNAVALFMIELLTKCLKQPEVNAELFYFIEDALHQLDQATGPITANFPLFFALHLPVFFGFRISDEYSDDHHYLDLQEGTFVSTQPNHLHYLQDKEAEAVSHILKVMQPNELREVSLNQEARRRMMYGIEQYYSLNVSDFGSLKTVPVLREILS
jgi:DNA repair protein RecO (recombination protein O)